MTEAVETLIGKKLDARYALLDKLGAGGQGEVWRAHDSTRGVDIALKVLNPTTRAQEAWDALEHEYAIASLLDHPSILKVFPPERAGDAMVLPMELASGGDLRRLRGAGFLEIIPVLLEVAQALEHAHERGVVHRDLKPGNILFDARGRARLADFGVAETALTAVGPQGTGSSTTPTRDTNRHGYSPFTASPAQLRGEPPTPADDVYGLGALAYELLSGYPPYYPHFDKKRAMEERVPVLVPTRQIPPLLGTLVMHMLAKDPKRRPRTMREVIDELDASINDTLTYDFDNVSPATPTASTATAAAAAAAIAVNAAKAAAAVSANATNAANSQARPSSWTPDSHDRRSSPDRRGRRRDDWAPQTQVPRESADLSGAVGSADGSGSHPERSTHSNNSSADTSANASAESRPTRRTGADALARIDAALERAAADAAAHPKPPPDASTTSGDTGTHERPSPSVSTTSADSGTYSRPSASAPTTSADTGSHPRPSPGASTKSDDDADVQQTSSRPAPATSGDTAIQPRYSQFSSATAFSGSQPRTSYFASETSADVPSRVKPPPQPAPPSAGDTGTRPRSPQPAPMTAAEAAAIVAAARAAAKQAEAAQFDTSQTVALPPLSFDTSQTVALPPLSMDYVPPPESEPTASERPSHSSARTSSPSVRSDRAESTRHGSSRKVSRTSQAGSSASGSSRGAATTPRSESASRHASSATSDSLAPTFLRTLPERSASSGSSVDSPTSKSTVPNRAGGPTSAAPGNRTSVSAASGSPSGFDRDGAPAPAARGNSPPLPAAPTSSMWPIEGKGSSSPQATPAHAHTSTSDATLPYFNSGAAQRPLDTVGVQQQSDVRRFSSGAQPSTLRRETVTVGTYPDPTSILTRDTVHSAPMHVNWGDVNLDGLPKVARLEPIRTRRWPWVVFGLMAGAAAAVYFWLPRFDTQQLPPEVAAVVEPLKTAIASNSLGPTNSPADASHGQGSTALSASGADGAAQSSAPQAPGSQSPGLGASSSQPSGSQAPGPQRTEAQTPVTRAGRSAGAPGANGTAGANGAVGTAADGGHFGIPMAAGSARSSSATSPRVSPAIGLGTTAAAASAGAAIGSAANAASTQPFTAVEEQRLRQMRQLFDNRLASLEARGAGAWGGREFAMAKTRAAESVGAHDAGNPRISQERLAAATKLLDTVESKAPQALTAEVAAGEQALGAGQQEVAGQAFDLARRINPNDRRATDGQRRAQNLPAILPLLADAQNAEAAHDYARAAQDYSQALSLDPGNATAKAGQARANAAFGDDNYARAVGSGFAALGAGRLDEAHEAFVKARALNPRGAEALEGLKRVGAALTARGFASMRQRALGLEAQERWDEAQRTYEDVLAADSSLAFAQEGKARTTSRADLSIRLQQILDRPDRLSAPGVREDARALLETARAQSPQGPVIRSQIARLEILIPGFDRPVHLSLVSDNSTQVAISSVGAFGTFSRRDIELRPGKYTVVGTRNGFRDVRREITVAPGQDSQTVRVTCSEPI